MFDFYVFNNFHAIFSIAKMDFLLEIMIISIILRNQWPFDTFICKFPVDEHVSKISISLTYTKIKIETFVMIIRILS